MELPRRQHHGLFCHGTQDDHQGFTGQSALFGLRAEADLAGDDQWTQLTFGAVVVGWDGRTFGPVIESSCSVAEYILDFLNARMLRR